MEKNIPVKKQHSWKTGLLLFDMCPLPLGQISPAFILTTLTLKNMFSILSNNSVLVHVQQG
jgi:hypothetical protein